MIKIIAIVIFISLVSVGKGSVVVEVGVLLPISYAPHLPSDQWVSALQLASITPITAADNITINLHIKDTQGSFEGTIEKCLELVSEGVDVVIGEVDEENTAAAQSLLAPNKIPQIVPLSSSTLLLDSTKHPYLLQTDPSNAQQAKALVSLIRYWGWTRCTTISSQDDYGNDILRYFQTEAAIQGLSLWSSVQFVSGMGITDMVANLQKARSSIFVLLTQSEDAYSVLMAASTYGLTGTNIVWIGGAPVANMLSNTTDLALKQAAHGLITIAPARGSGPDFTDLETRLVNYSSNSASAMTVGVTRVYDSLQFLRAAVLSNESVIGNGKQLLSALRATSYTGVSGLLHLNSYGSYSSSNFDILNFNLELVNIGSYIGGSFILTGQPIFPSGSVTKPTDLPRELRLGFFATNFAPAWESFLDYLFNTTNAQNLVGGNFTLSFVEGYSGGNSGHAIALATSMCVDDDVIGVMGASTSADSILISPVFANYKVPLLSYAATSEDLSSKAKYPYFLRDIPSDGIQGLSIAHFITGLNWKSCAIIATNDAYGTSILNEFLPVASALNITIITQQLFFSGGSPSTQVTAVKAAKAVVIVVFASSNDIKSVLEVGISLNMMGVGYQWITTEAGAGLIPITPDLAGNCTGILTTTPSANGAALPSVIDAVSKVNQTQYPGLVTQVLQSYGLYLYDSVMMYVDAIHRMIQDGVPPNNGTALLHYLYNSTINGVTGTMNIDSNGNRIGMYELDNWNGTTYKKVALWDSATGVTIVNPIIWMGNGSKPVDILPVCGIGSFLFLNASGPFCGKCLPGSYNPITGATSCLPCPVGSYTADYGNDQCISCAPGFFQAAEGATSCSICEIGRYSSSPQSANCTLCAAGTYTNTTRSTTCQRCDLGQYNSGEGEISCKECPTGMSTQFFGASSLADCSCVSSTYYSNETKACESCPEGGVCPGGLSAPHAESGYWFTEAAPLNFFKCVDVHACPGGPADICASNYDGRLCAHCADGYTFRDDGCHQCNSGVSVLFIFVVVIGVIVAIIMVHFLYTQAYIPYIRTLGVGTSVSILVNHFQILAIFGVFNSQWPSPLTRLFGIVSIFNVNLDWISITCFFGKGFLTSYSIKLLLPVYFAILALLAWVLNLLHKQMVSTGFGRFVRHSFPEAYAGPGKTRSSWIKHLVVSYLADNRPISWRAVINSFAAFLDLCYVYMISTAFQIFQCYRQPDGSHTLLSDASITCYSDEWYHLLPSGIIALAFYGVGVPIGFAAILYYGRDKVQEDSFHQTFGYFTRRFRRECYWWQMISIARKFLLSFLIVTFAVTPQTQFTTSLAVMFASFVVQLQFRPYSLSIHNRDEGISQGALLLILVCGLLTFIPADEAFSIIIAVIMFLIIGAQVVTVAWSIYYLLRTYSVRSGSQVSSLSSYNGREFNDDNLHLDPIVVRDWLEHQASEDEQESFAHMLTKVASFRNRSSKSEPKLQFTGSSWTADDL